MEGTHTICYSEEKESSKSKASYWNYIFLKIEDCEGWVSYAGSSFISVNMVCVRVWVFFLPPDFDTMFE
jgi:hypothetical protein